LVVLWVGIYHPTPTKPTIAHGIVSIWQVIGIR
jgi:hypothetical protein